MPPERGDAPEQRGLWRSDPERRRLAGMAASRGETVATAGNRPVRLDDPGSVWLVERGSLDVFFVSVRDGVTEAPFRHVLRLETGRLAFGAASAEELWLVAKGLPDTVLRRMSAADLAGAADAAAAGGLHRVLAGDADHWIAGIAAAIAAAIEIHPRPDLRLAEGARAGAAGVSTSADGVVWVEGAAPALFGTEDPEEGELVPLTPESWAELHEPADITVHSSGALGAEKLLLHALPGFHRLAFGAEVVNRRLMLADQANLQVARSTWRRRDEDEARRRLFGLLAPSPPPASGGGALLAALRAVGRHERIFIRALDPPSPDEPPALADLLRASGVRARRVRLSAEDRWWRGDSGAMLAFRREDGRPVALLPGTAGRYRLRDPTTGATSPVGRAAAATLAPDAWVLYPPLPDDRPAGVRTLLATAAGRYGADLARLAAAGLAAGVLALAPAAGIGVLVDRVVPSGDGGALLQLALLLVLLGLGAAIVNVLRGMVLMRIEGRLAARATAALWDRLLRLPIRFHREYSSGEMAMRALALQILRDRLSGATGVALLSVVFLVPSITLVFLYDAVLGWLSLSIGIAALAVTAAFGAAQIAPLRRRLRAERLLAGHLSQLIDGIRKLQAAGAEGSARASWARRYREQKRAEIRIGVLDEHLKAFGAAVPLLAAAALFAVAVAREGDGFGVEEFLVAYVASMIFYASGP